MDGGGLFPCGSDQLSETDEVHVSVQAPRGVVPPGPPGSTAHRVEDWLLSTGEGYKEHMQRLRADRVMQELGTLRDKPEITDYAKTLTRGGVPVEVRLSQPRKAKPYHDGCVEGPAFDSMFKPAINSSHQHIKGRCQSAQWRQEAERKLAELRRKRDELEEMEVKDSPHVNPNTQFESSINSRTGGAPVHEYLFGSDRKRRDSMYAKHEERSREGVRSTPEISPYARSRTLSESDVVKRLYPSPSPARSSSGGRRRESPAKAAGGQAASPRSGGTAASEGQQGGGGGGVQRSGTAASRSASGGTTAERAPPSPQASFATTSPGMRPPPAGRVGTPTPVPPLPTSLQALPPASSSWVGLQQYVETFLDKEDTQQQHQQQQQPRTARSPSPPERPGVPLQGGVSVEPVAVKKVPLRIEDKLLLRAEARRKRQEEREREAEQSIKKAASQSHVSGASRMLVRAPASEAGSRAGDSSVQQRSSMRRSCSASSVDRRSSNVRSSSVQSHHKQASFEAPQEAAPHTRRVVLDYEAFNSTTRKRLFDKERRKQDELQRLRRDQAEDELRECCFDVGTTLRKLRTGDEPPPPRPGYSEPLHERSLAWVYRREERLTGMKKRSDEEDLQHCTFYPYINRSVPEPCVNTEHLSGYNDFVARMRHAKAKRQEEKQRKDSVFRPAVRWTGRATVPVDPPLHTSQPRSRSSSIRSLSRPVDPPSSFAVATERNLCRAAHRRAKGGQRATSAEREYHQRLQEYYASPEYAEWWHASQAFYSNLEGASTRAPSTATGRSGSGGTAQGYVHESHSLDAEEVRASSPSGDLDIESMYDEDLRHGFTQARPSAEPGIRPPSTAGQQQGVRLPAASLPLPPQPSISRAPRHPHSIPAGY